MFNQSAGYSLADIAAATGSTGGRYGEGMWGDGWWIILLFLFGWGGNGGWEAAAKKAPEMPYLMDLISMISKEALLELTTESAMDFMQ